MGTWMKRHRTKYVFNHEVESMDHILEGVLASGHPDPMKRQLIEKISEKGRDQHPPSNVREVLNLSMNWMLQGTSELQVSSGFKLFSSWAQHHLPALESFLTRELLVNLLTKPSRNQANLPYLLTEALQLLQNHGNAKTFQQHLKIIEAKSAAFVQQNSNIRSIRNYLQMLVLFKESLPKADMATRLAVPLLHALAAISIPVDEQQVRQFIADVSYVTDFLQELWKQSTSAMLLDCLRDLFHIISAMEGPEPSVCLGSVVRLIPTEVVESAVKTAVSDTRISDNAVNAALRRMMDWLVWPTCWNLDQWIICFLKELAIAKKFSILISVTESKVEQVVEKIRFAPVREASFNILSHMLLSFQHSPQPFHKILPMIPQTLEALKGEDCQQWRTKMATLLHYLMYLHTGFPDLYDPIIDLIKDVPCPSSEEINAKLAESRWSAQQCNGQALIPSGVAEKSDTGKTGLFNLGNTCYMNTILQTLFMCDEFRRLTLVRCPAPQEGLLEKLQHVFASLLLSQRPAVAPMKFLAASKPPWFIQGQQQDCSEFLKFLLDQIHEQQLESTKKEAKMANGIVPNGIVANGSPMKCKDPTGRTGNNAASESAPNGLSVNGVEPANITDSHPGGDSGKDSTLVREVFGGKVRSTLRCLSCKQESHRVEEFIDIPLAFPEVGSSSSSSPISPKSLVGGGAHLPQGDLPKHQESAVESSKDPSLEASADKVMYLNELLGHYLSPERLEGENQYHCDRCGKLQDGERTIGIIESPRYLILTLLRFAYDTKLQTRSKVFREVTCPCTLAVPVQRDGPSSASNTSTAAKRRKKLLNHLNPKLPTSVSPSPENCELYGLCSVVVHSGASSECGHYYCYSRHSQVGDVDSVIDSLDKATSNGSQTAEASEREKSADAEVDFLQDKWCLFNDSRVSHATYASFNNVTRRFQKDTPYVLVYRKLSLDSHDAQVQADPPLNQELRDAVNKDNTQYLKEQELAAKAKVGRSRTSSTSSATFDHWRDSDSDQGPPGSCGGGGGGLGGLDTSGARFVF